MRQTETDQGKRSGISSTDRDRLKKLKRENRELQQANEILRKAAAFFAQAECGQQPSLGHVKKWCRLLTNIGVNMGSSRPANNCRSPHPPITRINLSKENPIGPVIEVNETYGLRWKFSVSGMRTIRCMASEKSGGNWHGEI